jgi:hypothetical protein
MNHGRFQDSLLNNLILENTKKFSRTDTHPIKQKQGDNHDTYLERHQRQ